MLKEIQAFILEKRPKYDAMVQRFYKLPEVELCKDVTIMTNLLVEARHFLNEAIKVHRDISMLEGLVKKLYTDLNYLIDESKMEYLSDPEWIEKKNAKKMAKEERDLLARMENRELFQANKELDKFQCEVLSLRKAANHKKEDFERVSRHISALIWGLRTEEFFKGGVSEAERADIQKYLTTGEADIDSYLDPTKRR